MGRLYLLSGDVGEVILLFDSVCIVDLSSGDVWIVIVVLYIVIGKLVEGCGVFCMVVAFGVGAEVDLGCAFTACVFGLIYVKDVYVVVCWVSESLFVDFIVVIVFVFCVEC